MLFVDLIKILHTVIMFLKIISILVFTFQIAGNSILDLRFNYSVNNYYSNVICVTSGEPATSFYGECINEPCLSLNSTYYHHRVTVYPENFVIFSNTLILNTRTSGYYVCITRSENGSTLATLLTEFSRGVKFVI